MSSSIISLLLPLFLLFVLPSTKADDVTFNGKFTCNIPSLAGNYCLALRYMEDDAIANDPISLGHIECVGPKDSHIHADFDGGDGPFNYYYEFFVDITHNCNQDGRIRLIRHVFPDIHIDTQNKTFNYEEDLTDHGEIVENYYS